MSHNLRVNEGFQALCRAFGFLPPQGGKVRMGGCHGTSSVGGPLTLSLSREGEREPMAKGQGELLEQSSHERALGARPSWSRFDAGGTPALPG